MLNRILKKFGYITRADSLRLRQENLLLRSENVKLLERTKEKKPIVDVDIGDPSPVDVDARREYVSRVAAFHKDVMRNKLMSMLASTREALEKVDNPPGIDAILKGTCNALWLLNGWGEAMISEVVSYRSENAEGEKDEQIEILKDSLNLK